MELIGSWIAILDTSELVSTYDKISSLLLQALDAPSHPKEDPTIAPTHALLHILIAIIPSSKPVEVKFFGLAMGEKVLGWEKDQSVQKTAYRILPRLCQESKGKVLKGREGEIVERIVEGGSKSCEWS